MRNQLRGALNETIYYESDTKGAPQQLMAFITMTFSKQFLRLRKEHKLTQQEMADKCGMHITQVRRYEAAQAQPSIEILKKIAMAFNV